MPCISRPLSLLALCVLEQLVKGVSPAKIALTVKNAEGCPVDFDTQLDSFIDTLLQKEILVKGDGADEGDAEIGIDAFKEGFALTVDEFAEVQDLLLADPVHDVDVEQGWPIMKED